MNWLQNTSSSSSISDLIWELQSLLTCTLHCKRKRTETEQVPGFRATIRWVSMRPIHETKSHPRPISSLAGTSISALLWPPSVASRLRTAARPSSDWRPARHRPRCPRSCPPCSQAPYQAEAGSQAPDQQLDGAQDGVQALKRLAQEVPTWRSVFFHSRAIADCAAASLAFPLKMKIHK